MNKQLLLSFISKYNLGGKIESVAWKSSDKGLQVSFISDDQSLLGKVHITTQLDDVENTGIPVYRTSDLVKLLGVLSDDINVSVMDRNDKPISLSFSDTKSKIDYALAELGIIPNVPELKYMPDTFEVVLKIDSKFSDLYVRAKSALPNVVSFSLETSDKGAKIRMGQTDVNTDRAVFDVETESVSMIPTLLFNAELFKEVLVANKGMDSTFKISSESLGILEFNNDNYKAKYYFVGQEDE